MKRLTYAIESEWSKDPSTLKDISENALNTFEKLRAADPAYHDLSSIRDTMDQWGEGVYEYVPPAETPARIVDLIEEQVSRNDFGEAEPESGYAVFATTQSSDAVPLARSMNMTISAGGQWRNSLDLHAGGVMVNPDPDFVTYSAFKAGVATLAEVWPLPWAKAYAYLQDDGEISPVIGEPPLDHSGVHIHWISYLSAPFALGLVPPPELICERTPGGGMILSAVQERLDPTNRDHLRRGRLLSQLVADRVGKSEDGKLPPPARKGPY
jgi:hypothetical protein